MQWDRNKESLRKRLRQRGIWTVLELMRARAHPLISYTNDQHEYSVKFQAIVRLKQKYKNTLNLSWLQIICHKYIGPAQTLIRRFDIQTYSRWLKKKSVPTIHTENIFESNEREEGIWRKKKQRKNY